VSAGPDLADEGNDDLRRLRTEIERVDRALVELIAERAALGRAVGSAKKRAALAPLDPTREAAVIRRVSELAREVGAPEEDVRYIFWHLIGMSRRIQVGAD
jgi:chorismate mutase